MKNLRNLRPQELDGVFDLIGKDWMLITAAGKNDRGEEVVNTMTASWGGMGFLWNRAVAFCFVRPQRYTFALTEQAERFSLSFFDEDYRGALRLCGTKSGRELDKLAAAGLTANRENGTPFVGESRLVLLCRKLYAGDIEACGFIDKTQLVHYKNNDFHRMYICEIEKIYVRD